MDDVNDFRNTAATVHKGENLQEINQNTKKLRKPYVGNVEMQ